MSFYIENFGYITGFGGPMPVGFTIQGGTGGQSSSACFAEGIPLYATSLVSNDHTIELSGGTYTHYFWLRNETGTNTWFELSGGGLY
jgi:hypothetical protein